MKNTNPRKGESNRNTLLRISLICSFLILFLNISYAESKQLTGTIKDKAGQPLIGVSVLIKGTTTGTVSDIDGKFTIKSNNTKDILQFSYIGYDSKVVEVGGQTNLKIILSENTKNLDEVIVVGYGTQRKSDVTGSLVSVKADDMNAIPTTSVAEMLRGQAVGVVVTQNSSRPGGTSDIIIRGKKSINGGNAPLYIVDGVPVDNIDDFNSQDIASVEVLKDASAQSIYGARASNGVILVTTKKGADKKVIVDFSAYYSVQEVKRNFDFYSGDEWVQLRREAYRSYPDGAYTDPSFGQMQLNVDAKRYTNWENLAISSAPQQKYDISVRSGNETTKLTTSLGLFDQKGMITPASYRRYTLRFDVEHKLSKKVTLGLNANFTASDRSQEDDSFSKFITQSPLLNPVDSITGIQKNILEDSKYNPIWNNENMLNETKTSRILLNGTLDWQILKGFKYRLNASLNSRNSEQGIYLNSKHEKGIGEKGKATLAIGESVDYLLENIFTYDLKINKTNNIDATFVYSINTSTDKTTQLSASGFTTDDLGYNNIGAAAKTLTNNRSIIPRNLISYMGRLRYNLMDRYLFSASARMDGSSVFGVNNKWGIFPAASFGWRVTEEDFLKDNDLLNNLKFRMSYGSVGNQAIKPYQTEGLVTSSLMQFGTSDPFVGYVPSTQLQNPNLKWERTTSLNVGIDFGLYKDRISGTAEYYNSNTSDLLMLRNLNSTSGYTSQLVNIGKVQNRGLELSLSIVPIKVKDFSWTIDANFAMNENKIIALNGEVDANGVLKNDITNNWFIGHNIDAYYDYQFDGIWQTVDAENIKNSSMKNLSTLPLPGDIRVRDLNNDSITTDADRKVIDRAPKWTGSLGSTLKFKGVDFSFDFYTVQGATKQNPYLYDSNSGGDLHGNLNGIKVDYWTLENQSNSAPRPRSGLSTSITYFSSLSYQDASYIRLRNVTLGYTLPSKMLKSIGLSKLRFYGSATNLWTKTKFQSYSPEISASGYPEPQVFTVGLNASF